MIKKKYGFGSISILEESKSILKGIPVPKGKDNHIQLRISTKLKEKWQKIADKEEKTLTRFIIDTVNEKIDQEETTDKIKEIIQEEFKKQFEKN